jgi:hypothetical protein
VARCLDAILGGMHNVSSAPRAYTLLLASA